MKKSSSPGAFNAEAVTRPRVDSEVQRRMFYYMLLTRELEDRIERKLYRQGKIVGGVYVGRGQEAIGVGSAIQLRPDDVICPSHRDMGALLIRGMEAKRIVAQYMGRQDGYTRGRDGNMHLGDLKRNVIAFVRMLGDNVPVAAGIGRAFKIRSEERVVLCYFGDGATSRGDWHTGAGTTNMRGASSPQELTAERKRVEAEGSHQATMDKAKFMAPEREDPLAGLGLMERSELARLIRAGATQEQALAEVKRKRQPPAASQAQGLQR